MTNDADRSARPTGWTKRDVRAADAALPPPHDGLDDDDARPGNATLGASTLGASTRSGGKRATSGTFGEDVIARHAEMLVNRAKKTQRKLASSLERAAIGAYRLYDRDIPEVRAVVDWYEGHVVVAEYEREQTGSDYLPQLARTLGAALGLPETHVHARRRQARGAAASTRATRLTVREGDARFAVRLGADVDSGLFPHLRTLRKIVAEESADKRVLDLFSYTGTLGVAAVAGGAAEVSSVDPSQLHLDWAAENFALARIDTQRHPLLRDEPRAFLGDAAETAERWELALLDTTSFAVRSGANGEALDVLRDHRALVAESLAVLETGGVVWFVTGHQRFIPDLDGLRARSIEERTADTVPADYRNREVHRAWRIVK